jgi:hypothetical protein
MKISRALLIALLAPVSAVHAGQDMNTVRAAIAAHLTHLQNLTLDGAVRECFDPPPELRSHPSQELPDGTLIRVRTEPRTVRRQLSFLAGRARYQDTLIGDSLQHPSLGDLFSQLLIYSPERTEQLTTVAKEAQPVGIISNPSDLPASSVIDSALGLRLESHNRWLTNRDIDEMDISFPDDDHAVGRFLDSKKRVYLLTFDRGLGYALTSYQISQQDAAHPFAKLTNAEFRNVAGLMLPFQMRHSTLAWDADKVQEVMSSDIEITKIRINDPQNVASMYTMVWPLHSTVLDERTGESFTIVTGSRTLTDSEIDEALRRADSEKAEILRKAQERINSALNSGVTAFPSTQP